MITTQHFGQHDSTCFACKLKSLSYSTGRPPQHNPKDRWANDPVKNRIEELSGKTINTDELNRTTKEQL